MSVTNCSFNWFVLLFFKEIHLVYFCFLWLLCFCLMLYYVQFSAQFLSKFLNLVFIYFDNFIIIVLIVPPFTFKFKTAHLWLSCIFGISNRYLLFIFFVDTIDFVLAFSELSLNFCVYFMQPFFSCKTGDFIHLVLSYSCSSFINHFHILLYVCVCKVWYST